MVLEAMLWYAVVGQSTGQIVLHLGGYEEGATRRGARARCMATEYGTTWLGEAG